MKYLNLFEEKKDEYWSLVINIDYIPEIFKIFKNKKDLNVYVTNIIHEHILTRNQSLFDSLEDPYDVDELLELAANNYIFDDYQIYFHKVSINTNVKLKYPDIKMHIATKKFNI